MLKVFIAFCLLIVLVKGAQHNVTVGYQGDRVFYQQNITIKVNDTVTWVWAADNHNVVSGSNCEPDGNFTSGPIAPKGTVFSVNFTQIGTFPYYCQPHCRLGMVGTIFVTEDGTTAGGNGGTTTATSATSTAMSVLPCVMIVVALALLSM
eukprot:Phypoly_transcript_15049.p1 GENE.Phypoly_transcript_15049~~Phypoly_transcript_15049.p1  ORF type:complete len:150 (+),score=15.64 Phypoly_transcript_15049:139-588(+)